MTERERTTMVPFPSDAIIPERDLGTRPVLDARHLGVEFGGLKAVDDFNMIIGRTEIAGLIGPNGAGKTTIFNLITKVYQPTTGTILIDGKDTAGMNTIQVNKAGIARTFQNIRLFKDISVIDNVKIAMDQSIHYNMMESILRLPRYWKEEAEVDQRAHELLKVVGLDDLAQSKARNLPYGQQRKLEIARALATKPKLLLLDEPAAGMNPTETHELMTTIRDIRSRFNISVLLIEHDMGFVMGICDRLYVLDYGVIIAEGLPEEIRTNQRVITAYLGGE